MNQILNKTNKGSLMPIIIILLVLLFGAVYFVMNNIEKAKKEAIEEQNILEADFTGDEMLSEDEILLEDGEGLELFDTDLDIDS